MRKFGSKAPNKAQQRTALAQLLVMRASLDGLNLESLSRSYGLPVPDIDRMVASERQRRAV